MAGSPQAATTPRRDGKTYAEYINNDDAAYLASVHQTMQALYATR